MSDQPRTIPEQLDAATTATQFASVLGGLFAALEQAIDREQADDA